MLAALSASAIVLGLLGGVHCVSMCGAVGGALCDGLQTPAFRLWNVLRVLSYATVGALVGGGAQWLTLGALSNPVVQAIWVMLQMTSAGIALVLLWFPRALGWRALAGRSGWQPVQWRWSAQTGGAVWFPSRPVGSGGSAGPVGSARRLTAAWGSLTGLMWAGAPCGLLHGALLLAWTSASAVQGFLIVLLFGLTSTAWLLSGAALVNRLRQFAGWSDVRLRRLTGALLLLAWWLGASGWLGEAAGHGVWQQMLCTPALPAGR